MTDDWDIAARGLGWLIGGGVVMYIGLVAITVGAHHGIAFYGCCVNRRDAKAIS